MGNNSQATDFENTIHLMADDFRCSEEVDRKKLFLITQKLETLDSSHDRRSSEANRGLIRVRFSFGNEVTIRFCLKLFYLKGYDWKSSY